GGGGAAHSGLRARRTFHRAIRFSPREASVQLQIQGVSKTYTGNVRALQDLTLTVKPGVLGLLGPNGAGKSTLMRILATITRPSSGRVLWNGTDIANKPDALRDVLGYLPQDFGIYPNLTVVEFLDYLAAVKGIRAA